MKFCYVVKSSDLEDVIYTSKSNYGFTGEDANSKNTAAILENLGFFIERKYAELHPEFKQIIPCFMLRDKKTKTFLLYQRKAKHTEKRLAGMWTPVFGGHIDPEDYSYAGADLVTTTGLTIPSICSAGLLREATEETGLDLLDLDIEFNGFIYDNNNSVGKVHLGVLCSVFVDIDAELCGNILALPEISDIVTIEDSKIPELLCDPSYELEGWASIAFKNLNYKGND